MRSFAQRLQRAAELEDIAIAILPLVEEFEIAADLVEVRQGRAFLKGAPLYIGIPAPRASAGAMKSGSGFGRPPAPRRRKIACGQ
jgi:hypothetical protein